MSCRSRVAVRGVLLGTVLVFGGGMAQATTPASAPSAEELAVLKAKLVAQQNLLESQLHQLREQQSQIDELERRLGSTVSAPIAAAEAATNVEPAQAAIAVAEPAAMPPPLVTARYDGVSVVIGGSLRTTVNTTSARMLPDAAPFLVLPSVPGVRAVWRTSASSRNCRPEAIASKPSSAVRWARIRRCSSACVIRRWRCQSRPWSGPRWWGPRSHFSH